MGFDCASGPRRITFRIKTSDTIRSHNYYRRRSVLKVPIVSKLWKDPVWSAVIAALVVAVLTYFTGWWPNISRALLQGIHWTLAKTQVPNWLLIILSVLAIGLVGCIVLIAVMARTKATSNFLSYTTIPSLKSSGGGPM